MLGFDEEGREVLSYIEGESGKEAWQKIAHDVGLTKFSKLLRSYHDAIANYKPPVNAEWAYGTKALEPGEIMCHGDFGPWNITWNGDEPVGILDWDFVLPTKPEYDICYALEYAAPFRDDETALKWHHFPAVPDRKHRIAVFLDAYGAELADVVSGVAKIQRSDIEHVKHLANRSLEPQATWVKDGYFEEIRKRAQWSEEHRRLFE